MSIALYLVRQPPLEVSAQGACYLNERIEDVVFLTIAFPRKVMAHIHVSWIDPSKTRKVTVVGSRKMIITMTWPMKAGSESMIGGGGPGGGLGLAHYSLTL